MLLAFRREVSGLSLFEVLFVNYGAPEPGEHDNYGYSRTVEKRCFPNDGFFLCIKLFLVCDF
ncbi:hypothetical protein IAD21_05453 [Abditibacteriota bacterium]|nr:hypothetical protein IAD21_05453 [Abditibacteriota bacterium]